MKHKTTRKQKPRPKAKRAIKRSAGPDAARKRVVPIALTFRKDDFDYKQIAREGELAIYEQRWYDSESVAYEVVYIYVRPAGINPWTQEWHPAQEAYPGNSEWGQSAWTYTDLDRAYAAFRELQKL